MELMRWSSGEAAMKAGKWSTLWWEEAASGPMGGFPTGLRNLPGVTEPVLGPRDQFLLPLGTQAGRRDRQD